MRSEQVSGSSKGPLENWQLAEGGAWQVHFEAFHLGCCLWLSDRAFCPNEMPQADILLPERCGLKSALVGTHITLHSSTQS